MREYKDHFVAFLDILGFKEMITHEKCEDIYNIFSEIHDRSKANLNFNGVQILAYEHIQHRILSDSVIVFIDAEIEDAFVALLDVCERLQRHLANRDEPILVRGGISKGPLYYEKDIIYGQGLTNSYLLECKLARFPRVIFTGDTLEIGKENTKYMFPFLDGISTVYSVDEDGLYFIDYLPNMTGWTIEAIKEYGDRLFSLCKTMLNKPIDSTLREKYIWLKNKTDKAINRMSQVKKLYEDERLNQREKDFEEYNERFSIYEHRLEAKLIPVEGENNV